MLSTSFANINPDIDNAGDTVRLTSTYENKNSAWYENMGIVLLYVAKDDNSGVDPFAKPVDWRGVLTHGHLHENDNHGGQATPKFADLTKAGDGELSCHGVAMEIAQAKPLPSSD